MSSLSNSQSPQSTGSGPAGAEFIPTRWSLIGRLKNWDDQESWREFFDTYWRLIYKVALRSGLSHAEAEEVVQDTVISVCRSLPQFETDPQRGSFKNWLMGVTRWRILDRYRQRKSAQVLHPFPGPRENEDGSLDHNDPAAVEQLPDPGGNQLEAIWEVEWKHNLIEAALEKLKLQVKAKQFQVFYLHVIKELPVGEVARALQVSSGQVYMVKHRVGGLFKRLLKNLEQQSNLL